MPDTPTVVEIEFLLRGGPLGRASAAADTDLEVELALPRADGATLAFVGVLGAGTDACLEALRAAPTVREARLLDRRRDGSVLELVVAGDPVAALADTGTVVTRYVARSGRSRLLADVPAHADVTEVVDGFLAAFPDARVLARRETERRTPQLGRSQFVTEVLTRFTERQLEVLRVAYLAGYFAWPRDCRADDVAERLGVATPTFSQHLRAAERKLVATLFDG